MGDAVSDALKEIVREGKAKLSGPVGDGGQSVGFSTGTTKQGFHLNAAQQKALRVMTDPRARHTLLLGGSRSGKTWLATRASFIRALKYPKSRHLIVRLYRATAEAYIWRQTVKNVIDMCFNGIAFQYNNSRMIVTCPNGSSVWVGGLNQGDDSEGMLGSEWNTIVFDEANEMLAENMQKAITRLAMKVSGPDGKLCVNRSFATVNPTYKTHHLYRTYVEHFDTINNLPMEPEIAELYNWCRINPVDNIENLSEDYIRQLSALSPENRRRFLEGEWSEESKDALFKLSNINRSRVTKRNMDGVNFDKLVVAVDPAVSAGNKSDKTGIVVVGWTKPLPTDRRSSGQYYVLDDRSGIYTPEEWARVVCDAYSQWRADVVVGEINNGGDLVERNIRAESRTIPFEKVWATRGKAIRAQPVVALSERGDLHIVQSLPELEGEMTGWSPESGEPSPNRLDAMVWGVMSCVSTIKREARILGSV